ncbi:MAG: alpha/beta hydrolase [Aquificaceae bacterium]|nr:alpha/beta hydrolase [Aquificaceae bacterium]
MPRSGVRVPPDPYFFLHGWGFSSKVLGSVPSVDLPFHGESSLDYKDFWHLARDCALIAPKGSVLMGWSMGASLALVMAYLFPSRFRALMLVGASACFSCFWQEKNLRGFLLRLEREGEAFLREFRKIAYPKTFDDRVELYGAKVMLKDYMKLDIRRLLPHIKQRAIILHGTKDPVVPFKHALNLYNMLKRAKLITFPGGHFPEDEGLIFKVLKSL